MSTESPCSCGRSMNAAGMTQSDRLSVQFLRMARNTIAEQGSGFILCHVGRDSRFLSDQFQPMRETLRRCVFRCVVVANLVIYIRYTTVCRWNDQMYA